MLEGRGRVGREEWGGGGGGGKRGKKGDKYARANRMHMSFGLL